MKHWRLMLALTLLLIAMMSSPGYGQGASSALTGTVMDASGGVIPGAEVAVKEEATGAQFHTITAGNGTFSIPSLHAGAYTATVSMTSFKQSIIKNIVLVVGAPTNITVKLEVGGSNETVTVTAGGEIVQATSATISTTMSSTQIAQLPLATRNALDFMVFLPGANTTGSSRNTTFMGAPNSTVHITVDGVPTQDQNYMGQYGGDGFYSMITPRPDSVQEVSVSTAAAGADASGAGAVQIRFVRARATTNSTAASMTTSATRRSTLTTGSTTGMPRPSIMAMARAWARNARHSSSPPNGTTARRRAADPFCIRPAAASAGRSPYRVCFLVRTRHSSSLTSRRSNCPTHVLGPAQSIPRIWSEGSSPMWPAER